MRFLRFLFSGWRAGQEQGLQTFDVRQFSASPAYPEMIRAFDPNKTKHHQSNTPTDARLVAFAGSIRGPRHSTIFTVKLCNAVRLRSCDATKCWHALMGQLYTRGISRAPGKATHNPQHLGVHDTDAGGANNRSTTCDSRHLLETIEQTSAKIYTNATPANRN